MRVGPPPSHGKIHPPRNATGWRLEQAYIYNIYVKLIYIYILLLTVIDGRILAIQLMYIHILIIYIYICIYTNTILDSYHNHLNHQIHKPPTPRKTKKPKNFAGFPNRTAFRTWNRQGRVEAVPPQPGGEFWGK